MRETYTPVVVTSAGEEIAYAKIIAARDGKPLTLSATGDDAKAIVAAVNICIDSHLEACYSPDRGDSYVVGSRLLGDGRVFCKSLECSISPESLPVLLRRLFEAAEADTDAGDNAGSLAESMLACIFDD